jgi:peptidoglycan/LPS O-acetylase OafA/YrhL
MSNLQMVKPANANKQVLPSIDLMRVICAFMVVIIHTQSKGGHDVVGYFISQIFPRVAVPFFFMVSGYFLSLSLTKKQDIKVIFKYLKRVIATYTLWSMIYYLISVQYNLKNNIPIAKATKHFIINFFSIGSNYHLWYFPALIFSVLVLAVFYKFNKLNLLIWLSILLYIIGLFGVAYHGIGIKIPALNLLYNSSQFTPISRIVLMGVPFFVLGHMMNIGKEYFNKVSSNGNWIVSITIIVCFLIEIFFVKNFDLSKGITVTIFLYLLTGWVLNLCIKNPMINILKHSVKLRYISNFTYYSHPIYIMIVDEFFSKNFKQTLTQLPEVFIVFFLTTITAIIIVKLNNKYLLKLVA